MACCGCRDCSGRFCTPSPDTQRYTDFGGVIVLWAACGAPALGWTGSALPHPPCRNCERIVGPMPTAGLAHHGQWKE